MIQLPVKILSFCLIIILGCSLQVIAGHHSTKGTNNKGSWLKESFWHNNLPAPFNSKGQVEITINSTDTILLGRDLGPHGTNFTLNVENNSYLKVSGNLIVTNHLSIDVKPDATLIIEGNLIMNNQATVTINGAMQVDSIQGHQHNTIAGQGTLHLIGDASGVDISSGVNVTDEPILDPLPVELLSFTLNVSSQHTVMLNWVTASEINNMGFEIQRLVEDFGQWEIIGFVEGHYNHNGIINYSFEDYSPQAGSNYYRLKQLDYDGAYAFYGPAVAVLEDNLQDNLSFKLTRTAGQFNIFVPGVQSCLFEIFDLSGNLIQSTSAGNAFTFAQTGKPFIVRISDDKGRNTSRTIM